MLKKEMITYLIVHCADTPDTEDLRATDIHDMHLGFGWDGAGYHHIICRDGQIEPGRPFYWQGAHVLAQTGLSTPQIIQYRSPDQTKSWPA